MDMDIGSDGKAWVLSWKDAQYVLNTPHLLKYESGATDKPEGRWIPMAVWQEQGDITVVKSDNGTSTQQRFREGSQRFSVVESANPTERDTAFTVTSGEVLLVYISSFTVLSSFTTQ